MYITELTLLIGQQIEGTQVDDVNPAGRVVFRLGVVDEAEVDHAQHLNLLHVDRQVAELFGNE